MSINKPFYRTHRAIQPGKNSGYSNWAYIVDRSYAKVPEHYVRAFLLIQSDLQRLFEYIEPADQNLQTYSYRIHELFMRCCIEVEANFKAILKENTFNPVDKNNDPRPENFWKISDYKRINKSHHLSSYKIHIPIWSGGSKQIEPFTDWNIPNNDTLSWYTAYNQSKHDRQNQFPQANFENLLNAVSGLLVVLSSQFGTQSFSPGSQGLGFRTDSYYLTEPALGGFFHIEFPNDWQPHEMYDFDWRALKAQADRFNKIDYDNI